MEYPLFSDRQQEPYLGDDTSKYRTVALTAEVKLPLAELWLACTEYIHLWWPRELLRDEESYLELTDTVLTEEDSQGYVTTLAEVIYYEPEDVLGFLPLPDTKLHQLLRDDSGFSLLFDEDGAESSLMEITSGLAKPRELAAEYDELGVYTIQRYGAELILKACARFFGAELQAESLVSGMFDSYER